LKTLFNHKKQSVSISEILSFPNRIQNTLIFYYLFPVLVIFIGLSMFFYISTKKSLDQELGKRLVTIASLSSQGVKPFQFISLQTSGKKGQTYKNIQSRFHKIQQQENIARIYVLNRDGRVLIDTTVDDRTDYTFERFDLHRTEIDDAFTGENIPSVLFKGKDGAFYKTAFTPIYNKDQTNVIAVVGVDGNATFFENLRKFERQLVASGVVFILCILFISYLLSRKIVNPIDHLVLAAQRIGDGQLENEVEIRTQNEIGFLSYVMDEMRQKIVERDQGMQVMLRGIAHEVRNPLGGIELYNGILKEKLSDPQAVEATEKIQHEVDNLKKLVTEFLQFAKKPALQVAPLDLHDFFEDLLFHWQSKLDANKIETSVSLKDRTDLECDHHQMMRVFHNLVENAIHAMESSPTKELHIRSSSSKHNITIEVSDTGKGIEEKNFNRLFKPFFTTKTFGNGLGLSLAQKIIAAHGGDIEIQSVVDQGTTVRMIVPVKG